MTLRTFCGKARRKILLKFFGRNLYANSERINKLEEMIRGQTDQIHNLENRLNNWQEQPDVFSPSQEVLSPRSYSQDGEDMVLRGFYDDRPPDYKGFYVDIGAFHPIKFSNTYCFYRHGWTGINIDATPHSMEPFRVVRKNDINLEIGVSDDYGELDYYIFNAPELNGFDKNTAEAHMEWAWVQLKETRKIKTMPINEILSRYLPKDKKIDFISMDIEGFELKILQSFDFEKYRPDYFLVEELDYKEKDFMEYGSTPVYSLLKENGYAIVAKTKRTVIYKFIEPKVYVNKAWDDLSISDNSPQSPPPPVNSWTRRHRETNAKNIL
jgi:FkbM family methyltransferase